MESQENDPLHSMKHIQKNNAEQSTYIEYTMEFYYTISI